MEWGILIVAGLWAGIQNAVAGGGSFITLPALMLTGLDARAANITSSVALFVGQATTAWGGRKAAEPVPHLPFQLTVAIVVVGGLAGAQLILITPSETFAVLVPWLILAATGLFAWGALGPKPETPRAPVSPWLSSAALFLSAIYGGYFGGGNGIVLVTVLTAAGLAIRAASATKNVLAAIINTAAFALFLFAPEVAWTKAAAVGGAAIAGGIIGNILLDRLPERALKILIVVIGLALTAALFLD